VRDKIEHYLTEREINSLLKKQIEELRAKSYIKILIREPGREKAHERFMMTADSSHSGNFGHLRHSPHIF